MNETERGTIHVHRGRITHRETHPGGQYVLRVEAGDCARTAAPGQFVHLRCDARIPMRRPLSIQRASRSGGWIELLFKTVGTGLTALAEHEVGDELDLMGPIGQGFRPPAAEELPVLIGGGVGIPPLLFLAERLAGGDGPSPVVFFGSELPFPFDVARSRRPVAGTRAEATDSLVLLEQWQVPARLASTAGLEGCHRGYVTELAADWLNSLEPDELKRCVVYACGPELMLRAAQMLAARLSLRSWLCLEEYMACAVGGCAGCTVPITTAGRVAMKRVCVDGPVFDGYSVYPGL